MKTFRPLTPSQRYATVQDFSDITKSRPEKSLTFRKRGTGGRNNHGRVTVRARGGGHARRIRQIDWLRNRVGTAKVVAVEYDPNRSARIALVEYGDGHKAYIIAPEGLSVGLEISSGEAAAPSVGNALPLRKVPVGTDVHCVEMLPGAGAQMVRSAGGFATLMAVDGGYAQLRLPSGEIRKVHQNCLATIGKVGNAQWENLVLGKAGRARWMGIRPLTRGMARNPVDHPNGGGQGKSKGGGGRQHLMSPWGKLAKGQKTRKRHKLSDKFIVVRRNGKPLKAK